MAEMMPAQEALAMLPGTLLEVGPGLQGSHGGIARRMPEMPVDQAVKAKELEAEEEMAAAAATLQWSWWRRPQP
jgi:hypothetical protein